MGESPRERQIKRDAAGAASDAANCAKCTAVSSIRECPNPTKGYCAVVAHFDDGTPYLAYRECTQNRRLKAEHKVKTMQAESNLGPHFWSRTFDSFTVTKYNRQAFADAKEYAAKLRSSNRWLILSGPIGTGKTHLAVAILQHGISQSIQPYFIQAADMIRRLGTSYQDGSTAEYIGLLQSCELLVIDDAGKEFLDEKGKAFVFQVFNARYDGDRPTIITTNLDPDALIRRYGDAVGSRLREVADLVVVDGPDYRLGGG